MNTFVEPERYNIYLPVHKGLRSQLAQLSQRLGALDTTNEALLGNFIADFRAQLDLSSLHLRDEERIIHPAVEARAPGAIRRVEAEHNSHRVLIAELHSLSGKLLRIEPSERPPVAHELYLRFSQFVAEDFTHMHDEETVLLPLLHSLFSDDELRALEHKIIEVLEPEQMLAFIRIIMPALTPLERVAMLDDMRAGMPPAAFENIVQSGVKPILSEEQWRAAESRLRTAA